MPTFEESAAFAQAILPEYSKRASYKPTAEDAAKAKALIKCTSCTLIIPVPGGK